MSHINDILERIAHIQVLIEVTGAPRPNVLAAEPYQPSNVTSNYCPFFVNEFHPQTGDIPISSGQQYRTEDIWMMLCVRRFEAATNLKLGEQETFLWTDAVYAAFAQRVKLSNPANDNVPGHSHEGLSFVLDSHIKAWDSIKYVYADLEFLALKFILEVNEMYVTAINA
jgi:hypothetical protein